MDYVLEVFGLVVLCTSTFYHDLLLVCIVGVVAIDGLVAFDGLVELDVRGCVEVVTTAHLEVALNI